MTEQLGLTEFSRSLVTTGDLDPIYTMLNRAELSPSLLRRWCIAYWLFYHAGVASMLAEVPGHGFWDAAKELAEGGNAPRGTERRHFRGANAQTALGSLQARFPDPTHMITQLPKSPLKGSATPLPGMMEAVRRWPQFGPWIAFKVSDMADAVLGVPVSFAGYEELFFDAPLKGAWIARYGDGEDSRILYADTPKREVVNITWSICEDLRESLTDLRCPHADRPLLTQEFETMLCKWKSHVHGHYPVGKDTHEIREALGGSWGKLSGRLQKLLP